MDDKYEKSKERQRSHMLTARAVMDVIIGLLIIAVGVVLFFREQYGWNIPRLGKPDVWDKVAGILFFLYGGWRIYRGYRKKYPA